MEGRVRRGIKCSSSWVCMARPTPRVNPAAVEVLMFLIGLDSDFFGLDGVAFSGFKPAL